MSRTKRLRIFAGPNGSGKSTLYDYLIKIRAFNTYYHINPDTIAKDLTVSFNLDYWPFDLEEYELTRFLDESPFQKLVSYRLAEKIMVWNNQITIKEIEFADITYLCAAIAELLRNKMLILDSSFSFESVFSHPDKITEIETAKAAGFKTYLYIISTSDPVINRQRVQNRVVRGGHNVPETKINERYYRTMNNLYPAFLSADRVFFFDNSDANGPGHFDFFAEKTETQLHLNSASLMPQWFNEYILNKIDAPAL
jgi:predicted ABC-type ATPase